MDVHGKWPTLANNERINIFLQGQLVDEPAVCEQPSHGKQIGKESDLIASQWPK